MENRALKEEEQQVREPIGKWQSLNEAREPVDEAWSVGHGFADPLLCNLRVRGIIDQVVGPPFRAPEDAETIVAAQLFIIRIDHILAITRDDPGRNRHPDLLDIIYPKPCGINTPGPGRSGRAAGVDSVWEQEKPEARKMLVNAALALTFFQAIRINSSS